MTVTATRPTRLARHDAALGSLLASLLAEVPEFTPADAGVVPLNPPDIQPLTGQDPGEPALETAVPVWAQAAAGFRVLQFRIGEFRFAMPMVLLHSVALLPDRVTALPAQPRWQRGVVRYRGRTVVLADLGVLIGVAAQCESARYMLVFGDGGQALVCDGIEDAVLVGKDDMRWSRRRQQRAWLLGLLVAQMCVLLDPDVVANGIRHG
ncbi:MAG: chemotaxis protein CheW [Gammaproteobacteria bacterium]|nr:chemotaxis protein CheW [Gammaproteobacteria bacterium]MCP5318672.1 chemotaxis protein CheW [Chromatiaceae bacterium]MCW5586050.1 chemotaxis protein CheW [Chromatiales bacterium]MCB1816704.1 chemotaxis protein CheW [Gammaproteobacteria bacterium]MCP5430390.1 chemotaxis protein CheW [Chromatiaceae bacterium]